MPNDLENHMIDPVKLCQSLIQKESITPDDAECQVMIAEILKAMDFKITHLNKNGTSNLIATHGEGHPIIAFAGHTDVVPTGDISLWKHPPFAAVIEEDHLIGRGACDMKGALSSMIASIIDRVQKHPDHPGTLMLLLTSDEEGPGTYGTSHLVEHLLNENIHLDYCIVGEPSSKHILGDIIKIGRRGSLHGHLKVHGIQGHIAYPDVAKNPIHHGLDVLKSLTEYPFDQGDELWPPTYLQISNIKAGDGVLNVTPQTLDIHFNIRFSPRESVESLKQKVTHIIQQHKEQFSLTWALGAQPYLSQQGHLSECLRQIIHERTGAMPIICVGGGTSDGRFLCHISSELIEYGLVNDTAHKINEHCRVSDIHALYQDYSNLIDQLWA